MKKNKVLKRITAAVLSALLVAGLFATTAFAADTGSITVHKFAVMGASSIPHDGTLIADDSSLGTKLMGAGFSLYKISDSFTVDSDTDPDTINASNLTIVGTEQITPADGVVKWDNLAKGYYVLKETTPVTGYQEAASSIIKFPFAYNPDPNNANSTTAANWDVHVYPKNVDDSQFRKTNSNSTDGPFFVGDEVDWAIQGGIDASRDVTAGIVTDTIDSKLDYQSSEVKLTGGAGAVDLVAGTDYTTDPSGITVGSNGPVKWQLTAAGVQKAVDNDSTGIVVDLVTTVNATAQTGAGVAGIVNAAAYKIEYATGDPDEGNDEETAITAGIAIDKYVNNPADATDQSSKLENAQFKLQYKDASDNWVYVKDQSDKDIVVTTDSNGFAQFLDFRKVVMADSQMTSTGEIDWTQAQTFKLQEVTSPEGYVLREAILEVTIPENSKVVTFDFANQKVTDPPIPGDPTPSFQLPLTGGAGTVLFTLIGLLLMGGAAFVIVRNVRKMNR